MVEGLGDMNYGAVIKGDSVFLLWIPPFIWQNKRRYRARRKKYVADLERRLKEARERGVQATKEYLTNNYAHVACN